MPSLSVVMSVYNAREFLEAAIVSILDQTYADFEFVIINDGSTDGSEQIITRFAAKDSRIRLISRENRGLAQSLNEGVAASRGEYIARMDADDISLPTRFAAQMSAITELGVDVLGGAIRHLGGERDGQVEKYPLTDADIKFRMLIKSPLAHPAVMARAELLRRHPYSPHALQGQDYDLWTRLAVAGARFANLAEVCLVYRHQQGQATKRSGARQFEVACEAAAVYGERMYGLPREMVRNIRMGMRSERICPVDAVAWSLELARVARDNGVSPEWLRSALFVLARRSDSSSRLLRARGQLAAIEPRVVDGSLTLLYLSKLLPFSNAPWLIGALKRLRHRR
jgi:glycosyltransferase involved in cell wall biosynthesis